MTFVAARCPQCGGDLQIDNEKETGFCMHCGTKIIVQDAIRAVRIDNSHMVDTWVKLGKSAIDASNNLEAYSYFTKVLEVNPDDWFALFYKGYAAGLLSTPENPRINEFMHGLNLSNSILDASKLSDQKFVEAKNLFPSAVISVFEVHSNLLKNKYQDVKFEKYTHKDVMVGWKNFHIKAVESCQWALSLIEKFEDEISSGNKLNLKKAITEQCINVCSTLFYYTDAKHLQSFLFGLSAREKEPYIQLYDDLIMDIRRDIPDYKAGENDFIDRLSVPPEIDPYYDVDYNLPEVINEATKMSAYLKTIFNHMDDVHFAEKRAELARKEKEKNYRQQKYWEEHPEEYKEFKKVEAERKEKTSKLQGEVKSKIDNIDSLIKTVFHEETILMVERNKLRIFEPKQKKAIDEKIKALQDRSKELRKSKEELNSYLDQEIKKINNT